MFSPSCSMLVAPMTRARQTFLKMPFNTFAKPLDY